MGSGPEGAPELPDAGAPAGSKRPPVRGRWLSLCALLVPLIFFAVVATGLVSMFSGRMSLFKPAASHAAPAAEKVR